MMMARVVLKKQLQRTLNYHDKLGDLVILHKQRRMLSNYHHSCHFEKLDRIRDLVLGDLVLNKHNKPPPNHHHRDSYHARSDVLDKLRHELVVLDNDTSTNENETNSSMAAAPPGWPPYIPGPTPPSGEALGSSSTSEDDSWLATFLSPDEEAGLFARAYLTWDLVMDQANAKHPEHKAMQVTAFARFLHDFFAVNKDTPPQALARLVAQAEDCEAWGFSTHRALESIRDFQKRREDAASQARAKKMAYEEKMKKVEEEMARAMATVAKLQDELEALKAQEAEEATMPAVMDVRLPDFDGAFPDPAFDKYYSEIIKGERQVGHGWCFSQHKCV